MIKLVRFLFGRICAARIGKVILIPLVLMALFLGPSHGKSAVEMPRTFTVSVQFYDSSVEGDVIALHAGNPYEWYYFGIDDLTQGSRKTCAVVSGEFTVQIPLSGEVSYFALFFTDLDAYKSHDLDFIHAVKDVQKPFLIPLSPDMDSVHLYIGKDSVQITGNAKASIGCQYEVHRKSDDGVRFNELINLIYPQIVDSVLMPEGRYYDYLAACYKSYDLALEEQLRVLECYKDKLPDKEFLCLKYDLIGNTESAKLFHLRRQPTLFVPKHQVNIFQDIARYYNDHFWFKKIDLSTDSLIKTESRIFYQYLLQKEVADMMIPLAVNNVGLKPTFEQILQKIEARYSGRARELLLSYALFHYFHTYEIPNWAYAHILDAVTDESLRQLIIEHIGPRVVGKDFADFRLTDQNGRTVTRQDFAGKVVVLDFWYTGCLGCAQLAKAIGPIVGHFRERDDVLFVSVSIDKDAEKWKKSVAAGTYTHPESVNLYTSGEGKDHPLIAYYNIQSYPTLMIIDKRGRLISINPPRPFLQSDHPNNKKFISLVEGLTY